MNSENSHTPNQPQPNPNTRSAPCVTDISTTQNTTAAATNSTDAAEAEVPADRGGGGGHRARRGAVQASILTLLAERPMNGYELITELETRSDGRWRPSPGAIYPALAKMDERGAITSTEVGGKLQFQLTERGRTMLAYYNEEQGEGAAPPWGASPTEGGGDLRGQLFELVGQARRLRRVGTQDQVRRAGDVIADATVKLTADRRRGSR